MLPVTNDKIPQFLNNLKEKGKSYSAISMYGRSLIFFFETFNEINDETYTQFLSLLEERYGKKTTVNAYKTGILQYYYYVNRQRGQEVNSLGDNFIKRPQYVYSNKKSEKENSPAEEPKKQVVPEIPLAKVIKKAAPTKKKADSDEYIVGPSLENILSVAMFNATRQKNSKKVPWLPSKVYRKVNELKTPQSMSIRQTTLEVIRVASYIEKLLISSKQINFSTEVQAVLILLLKDLYLKIEYQINAFEWPKLELGIVNVEDENNKESQEDLKTKHKELVPF
jgi:hypothetical protein